MDQEEWRKQERQRFAVELEQFRADLDAIVGEAPPRRRAGKPARVKLDPEDAFVRRLMRFESAAMRIAVRELGDEDQACDAVQDALIQAWQDRESYDPQKSSLKSWFLGIVGHECLDEVRRAKGRGRVKRFTVSIERDLPEDSLSTEAPKVPAYDRAYAREELSGKEEEAVRLWLQGHKVLEIARTMRISPRRIQQLVAQGKRKMRREIERQNGRW